MPRSSQKCQETLDRSGGAAAEALLGIPIALELGERRAHLSLGLGRQAPDDDGRAAAPSDGDALVERFMGDQVVGYFPAERRVLSLKGITVPVAVRVLRVDSR